MIPVGALLKLQPGTQLMIPNISVAGLPPYFLTPNNALPLHVAANGRMNATYEGPYLSHIVSGVAAEYLTLGDSNGYANSALSVEISDTIGRYYTNGPVHVRTIFGTGQLPGYIWEPWIIPARYALQFAFKDEGGQAANFYPTLEGSAFAPLDGEMYSWVTALWRQWMARKEKTHPFWFTLPETPTLTNGETGRQIDVKVGDDLRLFALAVVSTGDFYIRISDVTRNQLLMNTRIRSNAGIGNAQYPTIFSKPWTVPIGSRLRIELDNIFAGNNKIWLTWQGRKVLTGLNDEDAMTDYAGPIQKTIRERVGVIEV